MSDVNSLYTAAAGILENQVANSSGRHMVDVILDLPYCYVLQVYCRCTAVLQVYCRCTAGVLQVYCMYCRCTVCTAGVLQVLQVYCRCTVMYCRCTAGVPLCTAGDQESEPTQRLPSLDDGRSSSKVPDDLVTVEPQDNLRGLPRAILSFNTQLYFVVHVTTALLVYITCLKTSMPVTESMYI